MLQKILNIFNSKKEISTKDRKYDISYFRSKENQANFEANGYVILRNFITKQEIENIKNTFAELEKMDGYNLSENFVNSGRFTDTKIRNFVVNEIRKFASKNLKSIFNTDNCHIENGGNFQIKPASSKSILNPHQDSPIIDETKHYAIFVWIPLCDITLENGPLWILPKSHFWGNSQRSLNVKWSLEKHHKLLWKYMKPLLVNEGDVICFDTALIHASTNNNSNKTRIAITTSALPKNYELIEYFKDNQTPKNKVEKYIVNEDFYKNENINLRPNKSYKFLGLEDFTFENINKMDILNLIKKYNK